MDESHRRKSPHLYLQKSNSSNLTMPPPSNTESSFHVEDFELQSIDEEASNRGLLPNTKAFTDDRAPSFEGPRFYKKLYNRKHLLLIVGVAASWVLISLFFLTFHESSTLTTFPNSPKSIIKERSFSIKNVFDGEFSYQDSVFRFIRPPTLLRQQDIDPGLYVTVDDPNGIKRFVAKQLVDRDYYEELAFTTFDYKDQEYRISSMQVNYQLDRAIFATNLENEFRHSSNGYYWIKEINTNIIKPVTPFEDKKLVKISYAQFSPCYNFLYFVYENDLYVQNLYNDRIPQRITNDGSQNIFNAKPDWIYEEEVLGQGEAVWWSSDDSKLVFAKFDDTEVYSYEYPKYITNSAYNTFEKIKYPKPGTPNPKVKLFLYELGSGVLYEMSTGSNQDSILYDVKWLDKDTLLLKETDRASTTMTVKIYDALSRKLSQTRVINSTEYNGWIGKPKEILVIPPNESKGRNEYGYVDIDVDRDGYPHLFYFPTALSSSGVQLTKGPWEITGTGIVGFEYDTDVIFFTANEIGPMSQHLYGVDLDNKIPTEIKTFQNPSVHDDFYDFELSSSCRFAIKKYLGPGLPMTDVGALTSLIDNEISRASIIQLTNNDGLTEAIRKYDMPITTFQKTTLDDGVEINYVEIKPKKVDPKRKYPLLISVYAGPGSQTYTAKFGVQLEQSVVSSLDAIVLQIEPRGTGGKGWAFRSWAKGKLGYWEPRDITEVTKKFIDLNKDIIDTERVAIWGWSYGGFTTLKTLEYDQGSTFKYGIAVAPVTNWKYYDSIYTERYMGLPSENEEDYTQSTSVNDIGVFSRLKRFLVIHGTADDNVHIQNTFKFLDELDLHNVRNFDLRIFPDSDHSIRYHNAQILVYEKVFNWIHDAFTGVFDMMGS